MKNSTRNVSLDNVRKVNGTKFNDWCLWLAKATSNLASVRAEMNRFLEEDEQVPVLGDLRDYHHGEMTLEMMLDNIPEVAPYQETEYMYKSQFEKDYGVYVFEKDFAFEYRDLNPYDVYNDYQTIFEQLIRMKRYDVVSQDSEANDAYTSMNSFANDVDLHFYDALRGAYKGSWYTANQFAEAIHVSYREALIKMYRKGILMYQDWDNIYIVGNSTGLENPFVTEFFNSLYIVLHYTMKLTNGADYSFGVKRGDEVERFKY